MRFAEEDDFNKLDEIHMPIIVNLDVMLARRKMTLSQLSERVDISIVNLSVLKTGKAKAIRFSTLEAICRELDCQPADILEYTPQE
jgi:putative transcriptional regulator